MTHHRDTGALRTPKTMSHKGHQGHKETFWSSPGSDKLPFLKGFLSVSVSLW